ncbi:hypothetical protein AKJ52_00750 [candidate division MSBL1 archaeon SCGC-AAA382C18]|uniref:Glycosyltransferase 2-like domain-containing protein n=1 Tax=candidate division MSBL1 archaeon SCGC-AAA382C18 TaxID=1698281 RepID=A0A133VL82_9EURY|nr:hypothetical protein AKJ52_00750 [candidate division MSBL1 archaeon SCGC-AAA382C18]
MKTVAVVPAYDEEDRIGDVVKEVSGFVDRVFVVDDGSTDGTMEYARGAGAEVLTHGENRGYLEALKTGFQNVDADVFVTLDADGEMNPRYIPDLLEPIIGGEADLVMGARRDIPRFSEKILNSIAGLKTDISDTGTGYRAIRASLAKEMELRGVCPCGSFVLEAVDLGADIVEVPVMNRGVEKPRGVAWKHFIQFFYILKMLIFG